MQKCVLVPVSKVMACNSSWQFRPDFLILPVQEPLVPVYFSNHTLSQAGRRVSLILNYLFLFQRRLKSSLYLAFYTEELNSIILSQKASYSAAVQECAKQPAGRTRDRGWQTLVLWTVMYLLGFFFTVLGFFFNWPCKHVKSLRLLEGCSKTCWVHWTLATLQFGHGAVFQCWSENNIAMCFCKEAPGPFMSHFAGRKTPTAVHCLPRSTSDAYCSNTFWFHLFIFLTLLKHILNLFLTFLVNCFCVCMCVHMYNTQCVSLYVCIYVCDRVRVYEK